MTETVKSSKIEDTSVYKVEEETHDAKSTKNNRKLVCPACVLGLQTAHNALIQKKFGTKDGILDVVKIISDFYSYHQYFKPGCIVQEHNGVQIKELHLLLEQEDGTLKSLCDSSINEIIEAIYDNVLSKKEPEGRPAKKIEEKRKLKNTEEKKKSENTKMYI